MVELAERVHQMRNFNRFITRKIGVLQEGLLQSSYSLTEVRVMFELAHREEVTASDLTRDLGLDPGYLSRILTRLDQQGFLQKIRSEQDGRKFLLKLTQEGEQAYAPLEQRSNEEVTELLQSIPEEEQSRLLEAMHTIESILTSDFKHANPFVLRQPVAGDMGIITHKHAILYKREYGWNEGFEAAVSQIALDYLKKHDPNRERCWVAEMAGEVVGSIMVVQDSEKVARIRLLLVDPKARGLGLGTSLVREAIEFARQQQYEELVLWTNNVLTEARHIYKKMGFQLIHEEPHTQFGPELIDETWTLRLQL